MLCTECDLYFLFLYCLLSSVYFALSSMYSVLRIISYVLHMYSRFVVLCPFTVQEVTISHCTSTYIKCIQCQCWSNLLYPKRISVLWLYPYIKCTASYDRNVNKQCSNWASFVLKKWSHLSCSVWFLTINNWQLSC